MAHQLIPDHHVGRSNPYSASTSKPPNEPGPLEETVIAVPGAIVHLINEHGSEEIANGEFSVIKIRDGDSLVEVLARVGNDFQWPLLKDEPAVKLDLSHYVFPLRSPVAGSESDDDKHIDSFVMRSYKLSFTSKAGEEQLEALERVMESHTAFTTQNMETEIVEGLDYILVSKASPEESNAAYWTMLAPNVEEYDGSAAKLIASGSGQLIRGILWCGDVMVDRLKWGDEILKKRIGSCHKLEISPTTMGRIKSVKGLAKTTKKGAERVMNEVVKIAGHFTTSAASTNLGKKFFTNIPGEILVASLDGFDKICDAIEIVGKNVMSTSSTVAKDLITYKYGEQAGEAAQDGLDTAGHAIWTAWTAYKIRKAFNPKGAFKKTTLVKSTAEAVADKYKAKRDFSKPKSQ